MREAARKDSTLKFTALLHHVNEECLTESFFNLKKTAAVGVDGVTWQEYEQKLEANMTNAPRRCPTSMIGFTGEPTVLSLLVASGPFL